MYILNDLKGILTKSTHGLNIGDIKLYLIGFTENLRKKVIILQLTRLKNL